MTTDNFKTFAEAVARNFDMMQKADNLYVVEMANGDDLFQFYIDLFKDDENPIYRERTYHDCSACKQFIRRIGGVVQITNDLNIKTVWDNIDIGDETYDRIAKGMSEVVNSFVINRPFFTKEYKISTPHNHEFCGETKTTNTYHHFYANIDRKFVSSHVDEVVGRQLSNKGVFKRGLMEIHMSALEDILSLIDENSIYRGVEHRQAVKEFMGLKREFDKINSIHEKDCFVWLNMGHRAARFRNTVIGTLAVDLSDGRDLETAVKSFEQKVAPTNYKRPKALITPRMVQDAEKTLKELDMEHAIDRRLARIEDVSVNDVLYVDRDIRGRMLDSKGGLSDLLSKDVVKKSASIKGAIKTSIDDFVKDVLPEAQKIEIEVEGKHANNFVTVTAPKHGDSGGLFKWDNDFAWSYRNNVTDSIETKVKAAGGRVDNAMFRVSLAWFNDDDLDLHCITPTKNHIYFGAKAGILDVDMKAVNDSNKEPVENMSWVSTIPNGTYVFYVHNYNRREASNQGFELQVKDSTGTIRNYSCNTNDCQNRSNAFNKRHGIVVVVRNGVAEQITTYDLIENGGTNVEVWGVKANELHTVETILKSPNHWGNNNTGNKHWFLSIAGCEVDEPVRGLYNEFLSPKMDKHRKVFEVLGDRTKCNPDEESQISGLGFSETKEDSIKLLVSTRANSKRAYEVTFGN